MDLNKIEYSELNSKEKENFNYHKIASALADYGYDSMRLIMTGKVQISLLLRVMI